MNGLLVLLVILLLTMVIWMILLTWLLFGHQRDITELWDVARRGMDLLEEMHSKSDDMKNMYNELIKGQEEFRDEMKSLNAEMIDHARTAIRTSKLARMLAADKKAPSRTSVYGSGYRSGLEKEE